MLIKINNFFYYEENCVVKFYFYLYCRKFSFWRDFFFLSVVFFTLRIFFFWFGKNRSFWFYVRVFVLFFSLAFLLCIYFFGHLFRCWKGCINFEGFLRLVIIFVVYIFFLLNGNLYTVCYTSLFGFRIVVWSN